MNAFLLNQIAHMKNIASTRGAVINVCAVVVVTEATVSTVSVSRILWYLSIFKIHCF